MNDIGDQAMPMHRVARVKCSEPYEEDKARRLSPDLYHVMIFVVKYSVKESGRCRSMKFNVWTSLGEHYENIWYSTGRFGKPDLYREDRRDTEINGFLKRCLIRNVEALNDSAIETASESRPIMLHIEYEYVARGMSDALPSDTSRSQLELPLSEAQILPFVSRSQRRTQA